MTLNPIGLESTLREINSVEQHWGLPAIPEQVKLDLATIGDGPSVRAFLYTMAPQVERARRRYDSPTSEPVGVYGGSVMTGAVARGILPAPPPGMALTRPTPFVPTSLQTRDFDLVDRFGQFGSSVLGASIARSHSQFDTKFDVTQRLPYVKDPNAVRNLKQIGVDMGLLPKNTIIDDRWDPSMNVLLADLANKDFSDAMGGNRPGAVSMGSVLRTMGEALSPDFAFMVGKEAVKALAAGYWWNPGDIAEQHRTNLASYRAAFKEGSDASIWEKMGAIGKVVFGVADDIIMPIVNVALLAVGVGEVYLSAKILLGASKYAGALGAARGVRTADMLRDLASSTEVVSDLARFPKWGTLLRGLDEASVVSDLNRQIKAGKFAEGLGNPTKWYGRFDSLDPVGKIEAWRSMRGVMLGRKATQQMLKFTQAQMLMSAAGENPADYIMEEARGRMDEWYRENPALGLTVGVLSGSVQPRHIYKPSNILLPRQVEAWGNLKTLLSQQEWYATATQARINHLTQMGDMVGANELTNALRTKGANEAWVISLYGSENITPYHRAKATKILYEAVVAAGVEYRAKLMAASLPDWNTLRPREQRRRLITFRNKLVHQINDWDSEQFESFEVYLDALADNARIQGDAGISASLMRERELWEVTTPEIQRLHFGAWAEMANNNRSATLQQLLDPIAQDPSLFGDYLGRNITWTDLDRYDSYHVAMAELNNWVAGTGGAGQWDSPLLVEKATGRQLDAIEFDDVRTRAGMEAHQDEVQTTTLPSLSELLAPGPDDPGGLKAVVGLDPANEAAVDRALELQLTGQVMPSSTLLGTPSMANVLNRTVTSPALGKFTVAKLGTVTGNEIQLFIDDVYGAVEVLRTLRQVNDDPRVYDLVGALSRTRTVDPTTLGRPQFKQWVTRRLGGRRSLSREMALMLDDPGATHRLQNMIAFLQKGGVDMTDMRAIENALERRVRDVMSTDVWTKELGVPNDLAILPSSGSQVVGHAEQMLSEAREFAKTYAQDVHDAPAELVDSLALLGYKPVFGHDFVDMEVVGDALGLADKLPGLSAHGDVGRAALRVFMPDWLARSKWLEGLGERAGRSAAYLLNPGEKKFIAAYEVALKEQIALKLSQAAAKGVRLTGSQSDSYNRYSDEVEELYKQMWEVAKRYRRSQQSAYDDLTGFTVPQRIPMAFTPQGLRDAAPKKIVRQLSYKGKRFVEENPALEKAMRQALRDSLDLSSTGGYSEAMAVRGPVLFFVDFLQANGALRGLSLGLPMLLGGLASKPIRDATKELSTANRVAAAAGVAGGLVAGSEGLQAGIYGEDFDLGRVAAASAAAATGSLLGGRPIPTGVGAVAGLLSGEAQPDTNMMDQLIAASAGAGAGSLISSRHFRDMERGQWIDGRTRETSTIGRLAGAAGGVEAATSLDDTPEDGVNPWMQGMGAAIGAVALPPVARSLLPTMSRQGAASKLWRGVSEVGRFMDQSLTNRAFNLTMALRFTLSPLFDIQRHIELATFAMVKELELPDGSIAKISKVPMSRSRFVGTHGVEEWNSWANRFDKTASSVNRGYDIGFDAAETSVKYFMSEGILGFNPTAKGVSLFRELVTQGMGDVKAYKAAREILAYGVNGRTTGELTINAVFFPFSFQARYVGRWAKYLQQDALRGLLISEGIQTYDALNERYDLDKVFEKHLPLVQQLQKINAFAFGVSPGEFGGVHRPWINFFIPVATMVWKTPGKTLSAWNPYDFGAAAVGEGVSQAAAESFVDLSSLTKRIIPMWRDVSYLVEDLKEQNHVLFSPKHMTPQAEATEAARKWAATRDSADRISRSLGYQSFEQYASTKAGTWLKNDMARQRQLVMEAYPVWQDTIEQSIAQSVATRFTLNQIAQNPRYPVDYDVAEFVAYLNQVEAQFANVGYDIDDPSSLPEAMQSQVRDQALRLADRGRGFDQIWDKFYRRQWGPINRPLYLSVEPSGQKLDELSVNG